MDEKNLTHWKKLTDPNYLGIWDLNEDIIVTIASVAEEKVIGPGGKEEVKPVMRFKERDVKPLILNKVNQKTIAKILKTPYIEKWVGHRIQIYGDPTVKFGKEVTGGVRVREFLPRAAAAPKCTDCGNDIQPMSGRTAQQIAEHTQRTYGRALCASCATKIAEQKKAEAAKNDVLADEAPTTNE